jgi:serine/threonine protein kinase/cytochrome c-type biogenesis protein CcmH/NrfG
MVGQTIAHYKVIAKLGQGGMGEVFLATDAKLDRQVALKFLPASLQSDPESRERLLREARAASKLNHKNILTIYAVESADGRDFIVMEYVDGRSLKDLIDARDPIPLDQVLRMGLQVCDGLSAAHEQGIVHRDIKPANILLTSKDQIKITDFGLATWRGAAQLTKEGTTVGTAAYMSPEQLQGKKVDPRSDLFSLGVMLYEVIAGRRPFAGDHDAAISYAILNDLPEPLARFKSGLHPALEQLIGRALEKDPSTRYQTATDMLAELKRIRREVDGSQPSMLSRTMAVKPKRSLFKYVIGASAVAVLAVILLVLKPFKVDLDSSQSADASENSLAVMYFDNVPDPADTDKHSQMITSLLITDLSESQYLQVVSRQRLYDLLKSLGKESQTSIDRNTATDVARKAGVKWMLTGQILQSSPRFVITSEVADPSTGRVKSTQKIAGEPNEDIFSVVDKLSAAVRGDLATTTAARQETDRPVANVTTSSEEAYKEYLAGLELFEKFYRIEAREHFLRAVAIDSTLAMAYFYLSNSAAGDRQWEWLEKAISHSGKASWDDQHLIRSSAARSRGDYTSAIGELDQILERDRNNKNAYFSRGLVHRDMRSHDLAIRDFLSVVALDPTHKNAYNLLAYAYDNIGNLEKSIWAIDKYIEIAPDEPNPYDTRGDLYARNGHVELAISSYRKALEIKPDFPSRDKLAATFIQLGRFDEADSLIRDQLAHKDEQQRSFARLALALRPSMEGDFATSLKTIDDGIAADQLEKFDGRAYREKLGWKAAILLVNDRFDEGIECVKRASEIEHRVDTTEEVYWRDFLAALYAEAGDFARAESVLTEIRKDIRKSPSVDARGWLALGEADVAFFRGDYSAAIPHYLIADSLLEFFFYPGIALGRAYTESGQLDKAVARLERAEADYSEGRLFDPVSSVLVHYYLGIAYEKSGWNQKAAEAFERFLGLWHKAPPDQEEVADARRRLLALRS